MAMPANGQDYDGLDLSHLTTGDHAPLNGMIGWWTGGDAEVR